MTDIHKAPVGVLAALDAAANLQLVSDVALLAREVNAVWVANARAADAARAADVWVAHTAREAAAAAEAADLARAAEGVAGDYRRLTARDKARGAQAAANEWADEAEKARLVAGAMRAAANAWEYAARAADAALRAATSKP